MRLAVVFISLFYFFKSALAVMKFSTVITIFSTFFRIRSPWVLRAFGRIRESRLTAVRPLGFPPIPGIDQQRRRAQTSQSDRHQGKVFPKDKLSLQIRV